MSGGISATAIMAGAAVAGTAISAINGQQQKKAQQSAQTQAKTQADAQAKAADEATNRANQRRPNTSAAVDAASLLGKGGASGTMLTGPQGVDASALNLGRNTLLGQ
ncbi:hypothetical protein LJR074_003485 [Acidovorax sp. LjRoot74]|uniref:hypothetical protein n=1 Tax=unclassified Acidovorax TaxID=2684926 RepID=UPI0025BD5C2C|nr:hypothetical protein [Acidovorax sp.]MBW8461302.1 hypothetical protein [Acidovorax sp.]